MEVPSFGITGGVISFETTGQGLWAESHLGGVSEGGVHLLVGVSVSALGNGGPVFRLFALL